MIFSAAVFSSKYVEVRVRVSNFDTFLTEKQQIWNSHKVYIKRAQILIIILQKDIKERSLPFYVTSLVVKPRKLCVIKKLSKLEANAEVWGFDCTVIYLFLLWGPKWTWQKVLECHSSFPISFFMGKTRHIEPWAGILFLCHSLWGRPDMVPRAGILFLCHSLWGRGRWLQLNNCLFSEKKMQLKFEDRWLTYIRILTTFLWYHENKK